MPIEKLNKKEIKALKRLIMTKNKKEKLSKTARRGDAMNKILNDKASRDGDPNTEPTQELQIELDKARFLADIYKSFQQTPQYNQGNQGNNSQMSFKDFLELAKTFNKSSNGGGGNTGNTVMLKMMSEQNRMTQQATMEVFKQMIENSNIKFNQMAQMISGGRDSNPMELFMRGIDFSDKRMGDKRARTTAEMEHDLKREELLIKEKARQDLLSREEREIIRDDKKSERILDIGGVFLEKVMGNGVGALINDVMGAKNTNGVRKKKRRGRVSDGEMDLSLLDDL